MKIQVGKYYSVTSGVSLNLTSGKITSVQEYQSGILVDARINLKERDKCIILSKETYQGHGTVFAYFEEYSVTGWFWESIAEKLLRASVNYNKYWAQLNE